MRRIGVGTFSELRLEVIRKKIAILKLASLIVVAVCATAGLVANRQTPAKSFAGTFIVLHFAENRWFLTVSRFIIAFTLSVPFKDKLTFAFVESG